MTFNLLWIATLGVPIVVTVFGRRCKTPMLRALRYPAAVLLFWALLIPSVIVDVELMMNSARNQQERAEIAGHDSGPLLAATIGGWLIGITYVLAIAGAHFLIRKVTQVRKPNHTPDGIRRPADGPSKPSV